MKSKNLYTTLATLGLPSDIPAHGTIGSLVAILALYLASFWVASYGLLVPVIASLVGGLVIWLALPSFIKSDPGHICLDEVVGILVTFTCLPLTLWNLGVGFCLFRIFDIRKPLGISLLERLPGVCGVILDDVGAGVLAGLVLWALSGL
jgi:phosphatidylglycerophosphatase A